MIALVIGRMQLGLPGVGELPVYNISRQQDALSARVPVRGGGALDLEWEDPQRSRLAGTLQQGPLRFPVTLTLGEAAPRAASPEEALGNWATSSWMIRRQVARPWALRGANVIDVATGEVLEGVNVIITGDVIGSISSDPVPEGVRVVDAAGRYVIPGLFDLHAHIQPFDRRATPDSAESAGILRALLDHGREMQLLVEQGGASPLEALQIATVGSTRILGYERLVGTLQPGSLANLVVLSGNPLADITATQSIELVVHEGREHRPH